MKWCFLLIIVILIILVVCTLNIFVEVFCNCRFHFTVYCPLTIFNVRNLVFWATDICCLRPIFIIFFFTEICYKICVVVGCFQNGHKFILGYFVWVEMVCYKHK